MRPLRIIAGWFLVLGGIASAAPGVTNVSVVNITPSTFSVVWVTTGGATPTLSVFADPGGVTNLAGQVGLEYYPLHTGSPACTNAYDRRLNESVLRQKTSGLGLVQVRVSHCQPHTPYYFRIQETDNQAGVTFWPSNGALPVVTTALDTAYVVQSRQLVFNVPGLDPAGSIVLLSNSNTPSRLAAVAGDGVRSNEVYFSLSDLLDASGATNYVLLGNQSFTATVLGASTTETQTYSLNFTTDFLVGQGSQISLSEFLVLSLGSGVVRAGSTATLPVGVYASGITNLSFSISLPTNLLESLSFQSVSPQVGSASLQILNSNTVVASLASAPGLTLEGDQQLAQFVLATASNQPSVFLPLAPVSLQARNLDGSSVSSLAASSASLVIVNHQALLQNAIAVDGTRSLSLYGLPGYSYEIQKSTTLAAWTDLIRVPMTNLVEVFSGLDTNVSRIFYRAYEFTADPPWVQGLAGQNHSLLVYGRPGTNYVVQYATNLSHVVNWYPLMSYTLTNSFQTITNLPNTNPVIFYRVKR